MPSASLCYFSPWSGNLNYRFSNKLYWIQISRWPVYHVLSEQQYQTLLHFFLGVIENPWTNKVFINFKKNKTMFVVGLFVMRAYLVHPKLWLKAYSKSTLVMFHISIMVAGAVLQSPPSFIDLVSYPFPPNLQEIINHIR